MAYQHKAGTAETVTVPVGKYVLKYSCASLTGGTVTIMTSDGTVHDPIIIPAGGTHSDEFSDAAGVREGLGPGSEIEFVGTVSYFVRFV